jgi:hypothetical protein
MNSKIVESGQKFYDEHLKKILEPDHNGEFISIEPESGQYFLGKTDIEAMRKSKEAIPGKIKCLLKIGSESTYRIGGLSGRTKRQSLHR